jgi:hypothetical protein
MPTHKDLPYSKEFTDSGRRRQEHIRYFISDFNDIMTGHLEEAFEIKPPLKAKVHTNQVLIDMYGADNDPRYMDDHFVFTKNGIMPKHASAKKILDWYYGKKRECHPEKYELLYGCAWPDVTGD